jgi:Tfp pilus assembly protein PilV
MVNRRRTRRGFALIDAILGGALLALGLASVVTLSQRSLAMLQRGEHEAMAAAMLDELLAQVVVEGPRRYSEVRESTGRLAA